MVRSSISTSSAKMMDAMGALKMAAMAPADAQAIRRMMFLKSRRRKRPMFDPTAPPVDTVGPSSPTEPPKPTVSALVMIEA
jgi:hypothetical protein